MLMNENTSTRNLTYMLLIMLVVFMIFCFGIYSYDQKHNAGAQAITKARAAVSAATKQNTAVEAQNKALTATNAGLVARNTELANEKVQFCASLTKVKVSEPLCSQ